MATTLISIGPTLNILQSVVYAIPATPVRIVSGAVVQYSNLIGGPFADIANNSQIKAGFIQCVMGATTVTLTKVKMKKSVYFNQVISDGAIGLWELDDLPNPKDSYGAVGVITGTGVTSIPDGPFGRPAARFDGNGYITCQSYGNIGANITLEFWARFNWTAIVMHRYAIALGTANAPPAHNITWALYDDGDQFAFAVYNSIGAQGSGQLVDSPPYSNAQWHHIVYAIDSNNLRGIVYIDAVPRDNQAITFGTFNFGTPLTFGGVAGGNRYIGDLAGVAIYPKALTPAQVADHYAAGR